MSSIGIGYPYPTRQTYDNGSNSLTTQFGPYLGSNSIKYINLNPTSYLLSPNAKCALPNQIDSQLSYRQCVAEARQCQAEATKLAYIRNFEKYSPYALAFEKMAIGTEENTCAGLLFHEQRSLPLNESNFNHNPILANQPNLGTKYPLSAKKARKDQNIIVNTFRTLAHDFRE